MAFIEIKKRRKGRHSLSEKEVKFRFFKIKKNKYILFVYIGKEILDQMSCNIDDRTKFFIDESNPRLWLIKKSNNEEGFKIGKANSKSTNGRGFICITGLDPYIHLPSEQEMIIQSANYEISKDGLIINGHKQ